MKKFLTILSLCATHVLMGQQTEVPLIDVLKDLESKFQVKFAYDYQLASQSSIVPPDYSLPLEDILDKAFAQTDITYQTGNRVIIIKPRADEQAVVTGIHKSVQFSGFIKDGTTGEPLQNATLQVLSTGKYTTTNHRGFFIMKNVPFDTSSVEVKYLGYERAVIRPIDHSGFVRLNMQPRPEMLDPVVVKDQQQLFVVKPEAGAVSMNPASSQMYSSFGQPDLIQSIQLLPGVDGSSENSAGLSVRGGTADQNLVLLDGFTVFNLGHFFGTLSAFNANFVESLDLYKGGFGAEYGGRVSSVLDIKSREVGFNRKVGGSVGIDLMSVDMLLESAISDKVSVIVAGRRSYTDLVKTNVFNNISDNLRSGRPNEISEFGRESFIENVNPDFGYYDVNARVNVNLNEKQKLGISFYNSGDNLSVVDVDELNAPNSDVTFFQEYKEYTSWGNTGISLNYDYQWTPLLNTHLTVANSRSFRSHELDYFLDFKGDGIFYYQDLNVRDKNEISESTIKVDNRYQMDRSSFLEFGVFATNNKIDYFNSFDLDLEDGSLSEVANQFGLYIQQTYSPIPKVILTGGLRGTYYSGTDNTYLEPRVSLNYKPVPSVNLKGSVGRYYQFMSQVASNNPFATQKSFWLAADGVHVAAIASNHYIGGVTFNSSIATIDIEGYYKTLDGLTTYAIDSGDISGVNQRGALYRGSGRVRGMDVLVSREFGPLAMGVSYSLSYVQHRYENINNGFEYNANMDQRHQIKWVNSVTAGNWEFSTTFIYGSGRPYTGFPFEAGEEIDGEDIVDQLILGGVDTNNLRIPAYHRLDLGIAYYHDFGKYTSGKMGVNFFNLYNHTNIRDIRYNFDVVMEDESLVVGEKRLNLLGFMPSLYFNFYF